MNSYLKQSNTKTSSLFLFVLQRDEYYDFTAVWYAGESIMYAATSSGMSTVMSSLIASLACLVPNYRDAGTG